MEDESVHEADAQKLWVQEVLEVVELELLDLSEPVARRWRSRRRSRRRWSDPSIDSCRR